MVHRRAMELLAQAQVFCPAVVPYMGGAGYLVYSAMRIIGTGATIDEAIRNARDKGNIESLPPFPPYRGDKLNVTLRGEVVAVAKSRTYADRIANALNLYHPNERGI
jgi:hypothetical protein